MGSGVSRDNQKLSGYASLTRPTGANPSTEVRYWERIMSNEEKMKPFYIDRRCLPEQHPTHRHKPEFWEALGRCVATFGFLEEILAKAIFAFTATRPYSESEIEQTYADWLPKLEHATTGQLANLIDMFEKAVRDHPIATVSDLDELLEDLRKASSLRNVICHGSWGTPDADGASTPFFVNRHMEVFETAVDLRFLIQLQRHAADLSCSVIDTVTQMDWQFPGSCGPGKAIW